MRKPPIDTWLNFINHFRTAHQELRDTDATIDELGYHSANAIVEQIVDRLQSEETEETGISQEEYQPIVSQPPPMPTPAPLPPLAQANAVVEPNMTRMDQMMTNMTNMFETMQHNNAPYGRGYGRGRGRGRPYQNNRGRGRGRGRAPPRQRTSGGSYCSTHGNCAHTGDVCETPGPNHNPEATFANMMGGSTHGCYWLTE